MFQKIKNSYVECWYVVFPNEVIIDKIEVIPEQRNRLIGSKVLVTLMQEHKKQFRLYADNPRALSFYTRLGFRVNENLVEYTFDHNGDDVFREGELIWEYNEEQLNKLVSEILEERLVLIV